MRNYGRPGFFGQGSGYSDYGTFAAVPWLQQLWDDLTGYNSQQREFEQQEYLLEKEQAFADPAYQISRYKAAGVNPYAVGGSVSGNSPAAPAVSNSGSQGAAALGSLASILGTVFAGSEQLANANQTNTLLEYRANQIQAETFEKMMAATNNYWLSKSISTMLPYQTAQAQQEFYLRMYEFPKVQQEIKNLEAEHDKIYAEIDVLEQSANELEKRALKEQEDARYQKAINDTLEKWHYDLSQGDPLMNALVHCLLEGDYSEAEKIASGVETYHNRIGKGEQSAVSEFAYDIDYARQNGKNASDEAYGRFGSPADMAGKIVSLGSKWIDQNIIGRVEDAFKRKDAKKVRDELTMVLNNAYEQLEKYPDDASRINEVIADIQCALQLSNKELIQWYEKKNQ